MDPVDSLRIWQSIFLLDKSKNLIVYDTSVFSKRVAIKAQVTIAMKNEQDRCLSNR